MNKGKIDMNNDGLIGMLVFSWFGSNIAAFSDDGVGKSGDKLRFCSFESKGEIKHLTIKETKGQIGEGEFFFSLDCINGEDGVLQFAKDGVCVFSAPKLRDLVITHRNNVTKLSGTHFTIPKTFVSGIIHSFKHGKN